MQSISLALAGQVSEPIEVGPGARVTATGSGRVEWAAGTLADARNGVVTWQNWPRGASVGVADTLRRVLIRGVATGALTIVVDEGFADPGEDTAYWQQDVQWVTDENGNPIALRGPQGQLIAIDASAQTGASEIFFVSSSGSNSNNGSAAAPFLTLNHAISVAPAGSTIRAPGLVVREEVTNTSKKLTIEGAPGAPIVYDAFDTVTPSWSVHSGPVYLATITHAWGGSGEKRGETRLMPLLLGNDALYYEAQVGSGSSGYQFADEAAALAFVAATPGTFYVRGLNGSSYAAGWEAGVQEYFVHPLGSVDASTLNWRVAQRENIQPGCGIGGVVRHAVRFGGNHRDGFGLYDCLAEHVQAIFPSGHGLMVAGATAVDCSVYSGSPVISGVNAFHSYSNAFRPRTKIVRPKVKDYSGASQTCFNSHGNTVGVPTIGMVEIDDLDAENVTLVLGGFGEVRDGVVCRRPKVRNAQALTSQTGGGVSIRIESPECSFNGRNLNGILEGTNGIATSLEIVGPGYLSGMNYLYRGLANSGRLICKDLDLAFTHDQGNHRWFSAGSAPIGGAEFVRCALRCEGHTTDHTTLAAASAAAGASFSMTDCVLDGVAAPATATLTRTFYGDSRLRLADEFSEPIKLDRYPMADSGEVSVQAVNKVTNNGIRACMLVTSRGARFMDADNPRGIGFLRLSVDPASVTLGGGVFVNDATVRFAVFGAGGRFWKSNAGFTEFTEVTTGRSTDWLGAVSAENGTCFLLGSAGEITEYAAAGDTFTDRTSGVTYPLRRGWWDGTAYIVVGGDGTTGGILRSTDGTTWTSVYSSTDSQHLRDVVKVNDVWIAVTNRNNSILTSSDGVTWTRYANLQLFVNATQIVADELYDRALIVGSIGVASGIPTAYLFNVSGVDPATWARTEIDIPAAGVQSACLWPHRIIQTNFVQTFVVLTPWARALYSTDGRRWRDATWSARRARLPLLADRAAVRTEAAFVRQS
jgi:hypothetical protein